jgi:eukaryotic-like serine/threonine-protein kinase
VTLSSGTRLGAYTIVAPLGAGGMGEVYRAHDERLGRDVAIKIVAAAEGDSGRLRRFEREAHAIAALNHPNIITIHDVAEIDGVPYMATELIEGETLQARLERGRMPLREVVDIASQIADGLAHAHDGLIVHRDLKPHNVMVKPDGVVKIVDFGLGKVLSPITSIGEGSDAATNDWKDTSAGTIVGTSGYMSPEQVTGRTVDARSDQFAFGALLYEMLTGRRAFSKPTPIETMSSILTEDPPAVGQLAPTTPAPIVEVVERCLAKNPNRRYGSTRDLAHDLRTIQHDLHASRSSARAMPRFTFRRYRLAIASAAVVVVGVSVFLARHALLPLRDAGRPSYQEIAILPFTPVQRDPASDAFSDGIVELLSTNLTQVERFTNTLRVVPLTDIRRYGVASAKEALQTFGATLVVSGSVQRSADVVRLTLNLIDPRSSQQIKARVIDAKAGDPLALQDEAFAALTAMLNVELQPDSQRVLRAGGTAMPGAYDFYVQGRGYLQRFERIENVESAISLFQRAIAADDRFALAHAALGEALWRKYDLTKDAGLVNQAREECARAIAINDETAAVHVTLSLVARGTGQYEEAVKEGRRALALDPINADAHRELAKAYESLGQPLQAEATYKSAIDTRPGDWSGYNALGSFYASQKRYDDALAQFRRVIELTPDNAMGYSNLGAIQVFLKQYEEAAQSFDRSVAIHPTGGALSNLGTLDFRLGKFDDAATAFERAAAINSSDFRLWANLARAYGYSSSRKDKAGDAYRKATELAERELSVNPRQPRVVAALAGYASMLGDKKKALQYASQAQQLAPQDPNVLFQLVFVYDVVGDRATALQRLQKAIEAGYPVSEVQTERGLEELRTDPRFAQLIAASKKEERRDGQSRQD